MPIGSQNHFPYLLDYHIRAPLHLETNPLLSHRRMLDMPGPGVAQSLPFGGWQTEVVYGSIVLEFPSNGRWNRLNVN